MNISSSDSESSNDPDEDFLLLLDTNPDSYSSASASVPKSTSPSKTKKPRKTKPKEDKISKSKEEKAKLKEEKQKALQEKARLREEKKKEAEALKRLKPGECVKYINILLDSDIVNCKFSAELLMALRTAEIQYKVEKLTISHSILWKRKLEEGSEENVNYLLVVWDWKELVDLIKIRKLDSTIQRYQKLYHDFRISLVIYGIEEYFRFQKTFENQLFKANIANEDVSQKNKKKEEHFNPPFYSLADIETSMVKLQLLFNLQYKFIETDKELGLFVAQFTKSLAELPYKLDRCKKQECTDWFATADSKECIRVDNNGNGLLLLWQQQICQFPNVGLDIAQSIVSEYPSPQMLIEAYDKCSDRKQAELLLQDIPIRRSHGPLTTSRRIGPELSKKIFLLFNNLDGNVALSQD